MKGYLALVVFKTLLKAKYSLFECHKRQLSDNSSGFHFLMLTEHSRARFTCHLSPITYPLTVGVVGAPQVTSQPVSSIFLCSPLP